MRYESPVQFVTRSPAEDREVGGHRFEKGQKITLLLGAANRDPAIFSDPDRLDITRSNSRNHLAFGWGAHLCVGAPLARLEGEIVLDALMRRFPTMRLADADGVRWKAGLRFRGVESLKVVF